MKAQVIRKLADKQRLKREEAQTSDEKEMALNVQIHCTELVILAQTKVMIAAYQGHHDVQVPANNKYDADVLDGHFTLKGYTVSSHTSPLGALYLTISWA